VTNERKKDEGWLLSGEDLGLKVRKICEEALRRSIPSQEERRQTLRFSRDLAKRLEKELASSG